MSRPFLIHDHFENQVSRSPHAIALICNGQEITYAELDRQATMLARYLRSLGLGPRKLVGICLERSIDLIVAVLGVSKTGAAYVPVDPAWPYERMLSVLSSKEFKTLALVTHSSKARVAYDLQWSIASLANIILCDVHSPKPALEAFDQNEQSNFWDTISESAHDRVSAAGFISRDGDHAYSEEEVDEYRDHVVAHAKPLITKNSRVLEIGCGSGLIAFELAPEVAEYIGLDPSEITQEKNRAKSEELGYRNTAFKTGFAHRIADFEKHSFDLIVLASVTQFFPGPAYLHSVLSEALSLLSDGGSLLIADILDPKYRAGNELHIDEQWFRQFALENNEAELVVYRRELGFDNELRNRYDIKIRRTTNKLPKALNTYIPKHIATKWDIAHCSVDAVFERAKVTDPAYVIYTSGSTGNPKGVVVCHEAVLNLITWVNTTFDVSAKDRMLFVSSICFDLSVYDIFGVLSAGASLHIAQDQDLQDPELLATMLADGKITMYNSAPAVLQRLVPFFKGRHEKLRLVLLSGDWIPLKLPDAVKASFLKAEIIALGGATEATVWSNYFHVQNIDPAWKSIPYGKPITNARYYVLDEDLAPCAARVRGELYIGGLCLAAGYIDDPVLSAAKFIPSPFEIGERIYKTGDFACFWEDGTIEFLGRIDSQVKINGYRIELGEIESVLLSEASVQEAVVVVREDVPGDRRIVAYYVAKPGTNDVQGKLALASAKKLADYMKPSAFIELNSIPLTSNGKIARDQLPAPQWLGSGSAFDVLSETEQALAKIWIEILAVEQVGKDDNFFALGGHSMILASLLFRIESIFAVKISFREAYLNPSIAQLALIIEKHKNKQQQYAFDIKIGDDIATVYISKEDFEHKKIPDNAINLRELRV